VNEGLFERLQDQINDRELGEFLSPLDLLELSDELHDLLRHIMRRGPTSAQELAEALGMEVEQAGALLTQLANRSFLATVPGTSPVRYRATLGRRRARKLPEGMWSSLADRLGEGGS